MMIIISDKGKTMKKTLLCILFFSIGFSASLAMGVDAKHTFFKKHPNIARAGIIGLTALEILVINSKMEILGVAQANKTFSPSSYIAHNLANAFPTFARWCNIDVEQYTSQGPMVESTNIPALTAVSGLFGQNYYLTKQLYNSDHSSIESLYLTIGGFLLAWLAHLGVGILNCK